MSKAAIAIVLAGFVLAAAMSWTLDGDGVGATVGVVWIAIGAGATAGAGSLPVSASRESPARGQPREAPSV
jgi:hypothetical protein